MTIIELKFYSTKKEDIKDWSHFRGLFQVKFRMCVRNIYWHFFWQILWNQFHDSGFVSIWSFKLIIYGKMYIVCLPFDVKEAPKQSVLNFSTQNLWITVQSMPSPHFEPWFPTHLNHYVGIYLATFCLMELYISNKW